MKGRTLSLISILISIIGIIILSISDRLTLFHLVIAGGAVVIIPGLFNMIWNLNSRDTEGNRRISGLSLIFGWICSVAAVILGICMLISPDSFLPLIPIILGIILLCGSGFLLFNMFVSNRNTHFRWWFFIAPIVILAQSILMFTTDIEHNDSFFMINWGIALLLFGITGIVIAWWVARMAKITAKAASLAPSSSDSQSIKTLD